MRLNEVLFVIPDLIGNPVSKIINCLGQSLLSRNEILEALSRNVLPCREKAEGRKSKPEAIALNDVDVYYKVMYTLLR
jgi:hypothetical protein